MTSIQFFDKILLPYIESVQASINKSDQKALLISDVFRAQHTQSMKYVNRGVSSDNVQVDTRLTVIREVHARWINELVTYLKGRPQDIKKTWYL